MADYTCQGILIFYRWIVFFFFQVSLLFEVEDLAVASPATVSRCGMVFSDYKDLGWQPYVDCWLDKRTDKVRVFFFVLETRQLSVCK